MEFKHKTVLLNEMIDNVLTDPDGIYVDCTLGGGGHSFALAQKLSEKATLVGVDQDDRAIAAATERLKDVRCRHLTVRNNFSHVDENLDSLGIGQVDGFMFDLGVSSPQLDDGSRGFSYMHDGDLDMRMDQDQPLTAREIVNTWSAAEITRILRDYSEEKWAARIAQIICESGQGDTMSQLATRDHTLFGIKWASSFASCPAVAGKARWATREEAGGQVVTVMADFTVFKGDADCIRFRSRVLLQNSRYADNALIKEAIADRDPDKMAEGLKDAGDATSQE